MSSRESLWFCHECHAEMLPLMVPDPVCASCRGSFVEKMENPNDDPRDFAHEGDGSANDVDQGGMPAEFAPIFLGLQSLMDGGMTSNMPQPQRSTQNAPSFTFQINGNDGVRTIRLGNSAHPLGPENHDDIPMPGAHIPRVPNMSTFIHSGPQTDHDRPSINGALMAQYLMTLLGNQDHGRTMFGMPADGRMGDYVFNQEALDQIITQLMENSNAHRPVAATEEIIKNLPREVLLEESPTLGKDCAVCKEQFQLDTEDPDEQVVVTLPCTHPFHEPCILPWLRSSGTCPVCRHALVPQPEHLSTPPRPGSGAEGGGSSGGPNPPRSSPNQAGPSGLFQSFFNFAGQSNSNSNNPNANNGSQGHNHDSRSTGSRNQPRSSRRRSRPPPRENSNHDLPGYFGD